MNGGTKTLKAAKAKLGRRKKLVVKADNEVLELKKAINAALVALKAAKGKAIVAKENCEKAEFEFEVIKRKTNIEEIFWRFSHMAQSPNGYQKRTAQVLRATHFYDSLM